MQTTSSILMVRPVNFGFNEQTAGSNAFQVRSSANAGVQQQALAEFNEMVNVLTANQLNVSIINDTELPATPDSVFPNNWVSFHDDGTVYLYPMQALNRRLERRTDIIESLKSRFRISRIHDLSYFEEQDKFLEGTGSMVLDRDNKLAYACLSPRTSIDVINEFCSLSGYRPICFHAGQNGLAIYHTNVMMCIGRRFTVVCLESVQDMQERELLARTIAESGKTLVEISYKQLNSFAGNMLELVNTLGESLLVMSSRAYGSLSAGQVEQLSAWCSIIHIPLNTIENNGGGSARCMIAEIHLPEKVKE